MLRVRTGYSFRAAVGTIDNVLSRLKEIGTDVAPITDRASTFGWVRWSAAATKLGMRPVFGVELAVTESWQAKKPTVDYWLFIAKDSLAPVNKLVELATTQFRYEPLLTYEQALAADCFKIAGHRSLLQHMEPGADLWIGLSPATARGHFLSAKERGFKFAATSDNVYPREDDVGLYQVICSFGASLQSYPQHLLGEAEWRASVASLPLGDADLADALREAAGIVARSTGSLRKAALLEPRKPRTLLALCKIGAKALGVDLREPVYKARLEKELRLIDEKKFADYFHIVADMTSFARANMLVGPARGSSCGSLVCYLLGITAIDPIPYGLIFERFIDINRSDIPDIDIDFSDQRRQLVFDYVAEKYGRERVARLGTVATYQPRSALSEAGAALKVPPWKCDAVAESIIERSSGDSRALFTLLDTLEGMPAGKELLAEFPEMRVAAKMEGHPRHYSQHAAGIVISQDPISEFVAVDHRTGATMCDKYDAEKLNLLKIDALGLTQLSIIEDALEMAKLPRNHMSTVPIDDKEAFDVLNKGRFAGIFQYNGIALQSLSRQFKVSEFNDIVATTALARPGPMASGGANEWIARRNGEHRVTYPHPVFEPYLKDTLGIVVYQEQVMEVGRNIGDLDWAQVSALRRAMSKSLGKEFFDQYGDPWKRGAIAKGVDPREAAKIWDDLCAYGSWSFNKSHAVAYGMISYWCCWLKAHFPFEFAAASLSHENNPDRQLLLLREIVAEGYGYVPVDAELSTDKWVVGERDGKRVLVGPLSIVRGIGPKLVSGVLSARARGEPIPVRAAKLLANPTTPIDSLFPIRDAIQKIMPDPRERNIHTAPTMIAKIEPMAQQYEVLVFCTFTKINPRDENEAVRVAKRGYKITDGQTAYLNLMMTDDSGTIFGQVPRWKYNTLGKAIVDRGKPGKCLYAIKGKVRGGSSFRMVAIDVVRYLGDIEQ